ncbi:MAG TPA: glycosyltransferase family A protein [Thermoleophilaceae bacterium]|nr:glycosyltransferase family A protein [Thermoleophilaceae bacterium]
MAVVSVAIPVLNGGASFREVLPAVARQRIDADVELVVADSGSTDGTREFALEQGARVVDVPPGEFSHSATRNLLMEHSSGDHVAFLTDDAVPATERWLERLVAAFSLDPDVALSYGPYIPYPDAPAMVARELTEFFASLSPDGRIRIDRGLREEDRRPGPVAFFTSANGCVARWAWERAPFPPVGSGEDHGLAVALMSTGLAKAYVPDAGVVHSHRYTTLGWFRRFFDEFRSLREVYGHVEEIGVGYTLGTIRRNVRRDRAFAARRGEGEVALESATFHAVRALGAIAGTRAQLLPARVRRWCSEQRRDEFHPLVEARSR